MSEDKSPTAAAQEALRSSLEAAQRLAKETLDSSSDAAHKVQEAFEAVVEKGREQGERSREATQDAVANLLEVAKRVATETQDAGSEAAKDVQGAIEKAIMTVRTRISGDEAPATSETSQAYEEWTKDELYDRASQLKIKGRAGMKKKDLIKALRDQD
jgi:hypothetical protein